MSEELKTLQRIEQLLEVLLVVLNANVKDCEEYKKVGKIK